MTTDGKNLIDELCRLGDSVRFANAFLFGLVVSVAGVAGADSKCDSGWSLVPIYGGGYMMGVSISDSNPNIWYSYADVGGPYRSDDAGRHWRPLHQNFTLAQRNVYADRPRSLSIDPRNSESFVITAGERFDSAGGVYFSRDGGKSFRRTLRARFYGDCPAKNTGSTLARDPRNPDRLVCGEDFDGLFLSEDNGETWRSVGETGEHWFTDIRFDTTVPGRVYASAPNRSSWRWGYVGFKNNPKHRFEGFFRSDDGGCNWAKVSSVCPWEMTQMTGGGPLVGLFGGMNENGATNILASSDGGATWFPFMQGVPTGEAAAKLKPGICGLSRSKFDALGAGRDFVLVANLNGDLYRRDREGTSWALVQRKQMTLGNPKAESHQRSEIELQAMAMLGSITVDSRDNRHWLATDWFELWETFDAGETWTSRIDGIMQSVSFTVAFDPNSEDNMCIGSADFGLHWTKDGGKTWTTGDYCLDTTSICYSRRTPGLVYACGGKSICALMCSTNAGEKWEWVWAPWRGAKGLPRPDKKPFGVFSVAVDPTTDEVWICVSGPAGKGQGGVYSSVDRGLSWTWRGQGMPVGQPLFKDDEFGSCWRNELVFGPEGTLLCFSSKTGKTYRFDRKENAWKLTAPLNHGGVTSLVADPFVPGRFLFGGGMFGESTDFGVTFKWDKVCTLGCNGEFAFDAHRPGLFVSATPDGIYLSRDGGRHFEVVDDGYAGVPTGSRHAVFLDRGRLFLITSGSGVWTRTIDK